MRLLCTLNRANNQPPGARQQPLRLPPLQDYRMSIYAQGLQPAAVNHVALTPLSFIERTAAVCGDYPRSFTVPSAVTGRKPQRCRRLASALVGRGIGRGDTVAVMLPNIRPCSKRISACR